MRDDAASGTPPLGVSFDTVLGQQLSPQARRFGMEHSDFLLRVDFKNIAEHPYPYVRSTEGYYTSAGTRHTIWLNRESPDFEALVLHESMRGIMKEQGFPRTTCPLDSAFCMPMYYLSSLLGVAITDPIIDDFLTKAGYRVYNREVLTRRAIGEAWLDVPQPILERYTFLFCKWTLLSALLMLDSTFEGETVDLLHTIIRRKFPEPWRLGEELSRSIVTRGFTEPDSALAAMLQLREALKLEDKVFLIDADGNWL